jgi:hypothetical protein
LLPEGCPTGGHFTGTETTVPTLAEPTPAQQQAIDLIDTTIPLACT